MQWDYAPLLATLAIAAVGGLVFLRLKVPAGAMLGAMIFVAVYNVFTGAAFFPREAQVYIRIFAGAIIGSRMKKSDVVQLKAIIFPAVLLVFGMLALNLSLGYGIHRATGLNLPTALLGSAPGGVQDMSLVAADLNADAAQVALLQTVRVLAVLGVLPTFLRAFSKRYYRLNNVGSAPVDKSEMDGSNNNSANNKTPVKIKNILPAFIRTMVFAGIGGFLVNLTDIPAGAMVGAMLGTVLATLFITPSYVPPKTRTVTQVCSGSLIGSGIGLAEMINFKDIVVPACILVVVLLIANFVFGVLIHKITKLDLVTSLFASSAGGLTDMALIADEMGADSPKVAVLQLLRLICVITIFPSIIRLFTANYL